MNLHCRTGAAVLVLIGLAASASAQESRTTRDEYLVATGRIERIDPVTHTITVKTSDGLTYAWTLGPEQRIATEARSGDAITIRYSETVATIIKSGAEPYEAVDTTSDAALVPQSGRGEVLQQIKEAVQVESIDRGAHLMVYRTADGRVITRLVNDASMLDSLKRGDIVEATVTRERAIELAAAR